MCDINGDRKCMQGGPYRPHKCLDCATVAEWDAASQKIYSLTITVPTEIEEMILTAQTLGTSIDWSFEERRTQTMIDDLDKDIETAKRREAQQGVRFGTL